MCAYGKWVYSSRRREIKLICKYAMKQNFAIFFWSLYFLSFIAFGGPVDF